MTFQHSVLWCSLSVWTVIAYTPASWSNFFMYMYFQNTMTSMTLQSCKSVFICRPKALTINLSDHKISGENWLWFLYILSWRYATRQHSFWSRSHHELLSKQLLLKILCPGLIFKSNVHTSVLKCNEFFVTLMMCDAFSWKPKVNIRVYHLSSER